MKTTNIFIAIAAVLFSFSSCEKFTDEMYEDLYGKKTTDDVTNKSNTVYLEDAPTICMDHYASNVAVSTKSDISGLSASSSADWISVQLNNGVTITVNDNPDNMREGIVTISNSSTMYTVKVIQLSKPAGSINGHEYVQFEKMKLATCNIGAKVPSDEGYKFAWGEISTKSEYTSENYKLNIDDYYNGSTLQDADNAARVIWESPWTMPSGDLMNYEWYDYSSRTYHPVKLYYDIAYMNHRQGFVLNDRKNAVFIPGEIWFSTSSYYGCARRYTITEGGKVEIKDEKRYKGLPIRPIIKD